VIDRPDNVNIYVLYASEDRSLARELEDHLAALQRLGHIDVWHEGLIEPGAEKDLVVAEYLRKAHIVLLLVSANFLSPDCYGRYEPELRLAYERQRRGEVRVVPVILRHCLWQMDLLAELSPLPRGGHPVRSRHWESEDLAFQQIAQELRTLAEDLKRAAAPLLPRPGTDTRAAPPPGPRPHSRPPEARPPGDRDEGTDGLIGGLLEILCTLRLEDAERRFRDLAHPSLYASGTLEPAFRRNNFAPSHQRGRLYRRPPVVTARQPTGRTAIGVRGARESGEEVKLTIARTEELGGLGGHVRIFYPADGRTPSISGLSL
jgi:hypothetical protein